MPRKCSIKIVRYETKEDDPERDHLKSTDTLEGPLYPLIHATVKAVTEAMSAVAVWTTTGLKTLQYPPKQYGDHCKCDHSPRLLYFR